MASRIPIRWRLTLWYVALLALALAIFSGGFYLGLRYLLYDAIDTTLRSQATLVHSAVTLEDGVPRLAVGQVLDPENDEQFVRLYDATGRMLVDSTAFQDDDRPPNPAGVAAALTGHVDLRWVADDDDHLRILSQPLRREGTILGVVEVGMESDAVETLGFALRMIAIAAPLVLLFAAGGGAWLARRALAPIDRITRTAAGIGERDLTRRITLDLPDDEVGRLARTFNAMLDRIEDAFTRQRRFTADAAHELRTPLALIQSQLELALAQPRDPDGDAATLEALAADVARLSRLSGALLALARSDARGLHLVPEEVDLAGLLDLVAEQYAPQAEQAGVRLALDTQPTPLVADQDLLLQVLVNLLDNAQRHAPPGSTITLGCRADAAWATFWVADEGAGIPPEHLPRVFERFYRADPSRADGGIGLGLSICKAIVEAHGGTIALSSSPGSGTTATVRLPRSPAPGEGQAGDTPISRAP